MKSTYAKILLSNLKDNYLNLINKSGTKAIAVVKADAYGHGAIEVVRALESLNEFSPTCYAVATLDEAKEIKFSQKQNKDILLFAPYDKSLHEEYFQFGIIPSICSLEDLEATLELNKYKKNKFHLNIDTGMGRTGLGFDEIEQALNILKKHDIKKLDGIYTHFATADEEDKSYFNLQLGRFNKVLDFLKSSGIDLYNVHAANSAAVIDSDLAYFDAIRPGISLYGYYPSSQVKRIFNLKPVMEVYSYVETIKTVKKGESVSYNRKYIAKEDIKIASVPIGYADGVSRRLSNKMNVIINDELVPQIGTVTMDRILLDVSNIRLKIGDDVIIIGESKSNKINAENWSTLLDTIPYEITCNIGKRVKRVYCE